MNAIDVLTREKLNRQYWLDQCTPQDRTLLWHSDYEKAKRELANIERALETLKAEAQRKVGVE